MKVCVICEPNGNEIFTCISWFVFGCLVMILLHYYRHGFFGGHTACPHGVLLWSFMQEGRKTRLSLCNAKDLKSFRRGGYSESLLFNK